MKMFVEHKFRRDDTLSLLTVGFSLRAMPQSLRSFGMTAVNAQRQEIPQSLRSFGMTAVHAQRQEIPQSLRSFGMTAVHAQRQEIPQSLRSFGMTVRRMTTQSGGGGKALPYAQTGCRRRFLLSFPLALSFRTQRSEVRNLKQLTIKN